MGTISVKAKLGVITDSEVKSIKDKRFEPFADLEMNEQIEVLDILNLAFTNVFKDTILNRGEVTLPTIGKIKIKRLNKIALKHKKEIINEMGYTDINSLSKAEHNIINKQVKIKLSKSLMNEKKVDKSVKILKINRQNT